MHNLHIVNYSNNRKLKKKIKSTKIMFDLAVADM